MGRSKESHVERTAHEPRDSSLHRVTLQRIDQINGTVRILRLQIPGQGTIKFLPGQWLDVYVPTVPKAGGFTITSPPSKATPTTGAPGYLELAIQKSPDNPPAAWLWKPESEILNQELNVRIGGSFVWPPAGVPLSSIRKLVLVAGGVGINPLMSILSSVSDDPVPECEVHMLYSIKDPGPERTTEGLLFLERIAAIFAREKVTGSLKLYLTGSEGRSDANAGNRDVISCNEIDVPFSRDRISVRDVEAIIGQDTSSSVVYVCGLPTMTDAFVQELTTAGEFGMEASRVLYEKWW